MKKTIVLSLLFISILTYGQKRTTLQGDIKNLKGITKFDIVFDYSNVSIPHYESEKLFLATKVAYYERQIKGKGEKFKKEWFANRKDIYEPMFVKSFNKWFNKKEETISSSANHSISIEITNLYTGYNVAVVNQAGKISAIFTVSNKSTKKLLFKGRVNNIKGGRSYEMSDRIAISYYNLAKNISLYIKRKSK